jgi:hypothetical protein
VLAAITRTANLLRASAGLEAPVAPLADLAEEHNALQQQIAPGEGLIAILAHAASTDTVRAWHASACSPMRSPGTSWPTSASRCASTARAAMVAWACTRSPGPR